MAEFVFMLTDNDRTVPNALDVLTMVSDSGLRHIGFKDVGASPELQKALTAAAHEAKLEVYLEVVSVSRLDEHNSVKSAIAAGVDAIVGGKFADDAIQALEGTGIRFLPFPGRVVGHPSVLEGELDEIADHAKRLSRLDGVHGVDLLAYRNSETDVGKLIRAVVDRVAGQVLVAGSVVNEAQIRTLTEAGAWGFTIGGAIFQGLLPGRKDVRSQVSTALRFAGDG